MAKGKKKLEVVHLVCEETGDYNYTIRRKTGGEKLRLKKFSPRLRRHTVRTLRHLQLRPPPRRTGEKGVRAGSRRTQFLTVKKRKETGD